MKKKVWFMVLAGLLVAGIAWAAPKGTAQDAKAMVKKAVAYYKANGQEKAFAAFNNPNGKFVDRDLYIYVITMGGKAISHGSNAKLIGKDFYNLKDSDGKLFVHEMIDEATKKGSGWVNYKWTNPVTKKIENKSVYFEKVNDVMIVCGFYKKTSSD